MNSLTLSQNDFPLGIWMRMGVMEPWELTRQKHPVAHTNVLHLETNKESHWFTPLEEYLRDNWHLEQYFHVMGRDVEGATWNGETLTIITKHAPEKMTTPNAKYWIYHDVGMIDDILSHTVHEQSELSFWSEFLAPLGMLDKGRMLLGDKSRHLKYRYRDILMNELNAQKCSTLCIKDDDAFNIHIEIDGYDIFTWDNLFEHPSTLPCDIEESLRFINHIASYIELNYQEAKIIKSGDVLLMTPQLLIDSLLKIIQFFPNHKI